GPDPALDAQRHDVDDGSAAGEHHPRPAVHRRGVHLAVAAFLAEHPGEEPRRPAAPGDDRPRRRDLAAAVGENLHVLGKQLPDRPRVARPQAATNRSASPSASCGAGWNRGTSCPSRCLARLTICRTWTSDLPNTAAIWA